LRSFYGRGIERYLSLFSFLLLQKGGIMSDTVCCGYNTSISIGGMLFKPGEVLSRKALSCISSRNLRRHLSDGTLVLKEIAKPVSKPVPNPEPPAPSSERFDPVKKWNVNPVSLTGMGLQELNIMVLERDPTVPPFETIEEAAAQLSKDFKGTI
jgi:hypothetical protein